MKTVVRISNRQSSGCINHLALASTAHGAPAMALASSSSSSSSSQRFAFVPTSTSLCARRTHLGSPVVRLRPRDESVAPLIAISSKRRVHVVASSSGLSPKDLPLGPSTGFRFSPRRWTEGLRGDIARRAPLYVRDWLDGFHSKSLPTVTFLFFACLAPVIAFGGLNSVLTAGTMGVVECILASGVSGMVYAILSGQPLTFLAPTGLTLAFTTALHGFCASTGLPFLPTYAWVGVWTSLSLVFLVIINACDLIKYCTRFTDDIFNSLIATNFIYEATRSLVAGFRQAGADKTRPFATLALALGTLIIGRCLSGLRTSRFLFRRARNFLSDFGPCIAIAAMTALAAIPSVAKIDLTRLSIPTTFALANSRPLLVPLHLTPVPVRLAAIVPAALLTCLFFLDQNISVRVVNSPGHRLRKGPAYHLDMLVLAICTFACAVCGLPLMCAGTVQSLNHVRSLATYEQVLDSSGAITGEERIARVQENRLTGFLIHASLLCSLFMLPLIQHIPMAVISGLFLFLGMKMFAGNDFLARIPVLFMDPSRYPKTIPPIPAKQTNSYTLLQLACLALLWVLKLNKRTAMFFPAVIGTLMFIRSNIASRLFPKSALDRLDGAVVQDDDQYIDVPASVNGPDSVHDHHSDQPPQFASAMK